MAAAANKRAGAGKRLVPTISIGHKIIVDISSRWAATVPFVYLVGCCDPGTNANTFRPTLQLMLHGISLLPVGKSLWAADVSFTDW